MIPWIKSAPVCNQFVQSGKHLVDNRRRVVFVFACCAGPEPELELKQEPVKTRTGTTVKFEWFCIPGHLRDVLPRQSLGLVLKKYRDTNYKMTLWQKKLGLSIKHATSEMLKILFLWCTVKTRNWKLTCFFTILCLLPNVVMCPFLTRSELSGYVPCCQLSELTF